MMDVDESSTTTTRLHITPLDPDLLPVIIPAAVLPHAANISFHTIECFPEKRYGFVNLPAADAEKLRKKLNGAVLRGCKIRIDKARADDMPKPTPVEAEAASDVKKSRKSKESKKDKKRKRDAGEEIEGVELEEGRKIKRGWTLTAAESAKAKEKEGKEKRDKRDKKGKDKDKEKKEKKHRKKEVRSKYTEGPECLIKTVLPVAASETAATDGADGAEDRKRRKSRSKSNTVVIHEFEKTTKFPTFLKTTQAASSKKDETEFVEGVGWVDAEGKVVEPVRTSRRATAAVKVAAKSESPAVEEEDDTSSESDSSSSNEEEDDDEEGKVTASAAVSELSSPPKPSKHLPGRISIPEVSSATQTTPKIGSAGGAEVTESPRPKSASSIRSLTIKIPPATPAVAAVGKASASTVHPLEALYKRPKPAETAGGAADSAEAKPQSATSFAFFDNEEEEEEDDDIAPMSSQGGLQPPMTPFTRQDFDSRHLRSAAPTPDTAHANRSFKFWPPAGGEGGDDDDEEEEDQDDELDDVDEDDDRPMGAGQASGSAEASSAAPTSDFQKWFWENRGDLNRSWKKRRKTAAKEKRYRENRSRASRAT